MSQENVEIWRAQIEGQLAELAGGTRPEATISAMAEIWDPGIELDATGAPALDLDRVYRGADAVREFWQEWFSAWETLQFDYELIDVGERVVMLLDLQMRGRSTGIEMPFGKFAWVSTFRDGLVVHVKLYMSQSEALEAVGLSEQAMSQENVELREVAEAAYGACNAGDLDAFLALMAEDVECTSMIAEIEGTTFRGHDGVRAWWETIVGLFEDAHWDVLGVLDVPGSDDRGVVHFHIAGRLGGVPVEQTMWQAVELRDGKVRWWKFSRSEGEALETAGLRE